MKQLDNNENVINELDPNTEQFFNNNEAFGKYINYIFYFFEGIENAKTI
jgi:hypothetical protein